MIKAIYRAKNVAQRSAESAALFLEKFKRGSSEDKLIILDDIFPHLLSSFRIAEYNAYLAKIERVEIHSTGAAFPVIDERRTFAQVLAEYAIYYPQFRNRVYEFNRRRDLQCELIYTIFLNNAFEYVPLIERYNVPFAFTLYPGGGFQLDQEVSDNKLRRVCFSPNIKKIIVTQRVSEQYLLEMGIDSKKIEFVFGGVLPSSSFNEQAVRKKYYGHDKKSFDICFVAIKYMPRGRDKGYDLFIEVAKTLARLHTDIFFHVVGTFDESDIDVTELGDRIRFYGARKTDFFSGFYSRMDMILSPNAPFLLSPGAFDGFPTGGCVEAGLSGVAVFCTDVLNQNIAFKDREEIVIISRDPADICDAVEKYYENYDELCRLAMRGRRAFQKVYSIENQMRPRLRLLSELMG